MSTVWCISLILAGWIALVVLLRAMIFSWLSRGHDAALLVLFAGLGLYGRFVHRARWEGLEKVRRDSRSGPFLVVSNHTGSVDPLLIQAGCRFHITWMMAADMLLSWLNWLKENRHVIPVDRSGRDTRAVREAIRLLQAGHVVGIFPEGRIVIPPHEIRPFFAGVGVIVARSQAPVLLVWVTGTPVSQSITGSLFTRSRATVRYLEVIDFKGERDAQVITASLRKRLSQVTGWPLNDSPLPPAQEYASAPEPGGANSWRFEAGPARPA